MNTNNKSVEFANIVSHKVTEKYKKFLVESSLHEIGCSDEEKLIESYNQFKKCVDNCIIINSELINFN